MSKNIEYVQSEAVGSEIVETATDSSKLGELITEAWATLYARTTGLKVVPQPATTVETEVVELKALLLALLRAVWKTPTRLFGGSTLGAAVTSFFGWDRTRLLGDTTYGIPAYPNASVEEAKAVLRRRDMSSGVLFGDTPLPDGMSLVNFLCTGSMSQVTEITDDNNGWVASQSGWLSTFFTQMPNVTRAVFGCKSMTAAPITANISGTREIHIKSKNLYFSPENYSCSNCDIWLDQLETCSTRAQGAPFFRAKRIFFPIFKHGTYSVGGSAGWTNNNTTYIYFGCYGKRTESIILTNASYGSTGSAQALAILEVRQGARQRIEFANIPSWDCYPNITAANIVAYIFDKLADNNYEDDGVTEAPAITIKLGSYLLAKLSAEQIAVATDKNYTVTA